MSDRILTSIGRFSWAYMASEGDPKESGPNKFKCTLMLPKTLDAVASLGLNPEQSKALLAEAKKCKAEIEAAAKAMAEAKFEDLDNVRWNPVLDGDKKAKKQPANKGFWLVRSKTQYQPAITNPEGDGKIDPEDTDIQTGFYNGCWGRVFVQPYTYSVNGNDGVALGLGSVQKAYNDERFQAVEEDAFGGVTPIAAVSEDFAGIE